MFCVCQSFSKEVTYLLTYCLLSERSKRTQMSITEHELIINFMLMPSGAGTNLKVGGIRPAQSAGKLFLVPPLQFFSSKSTITV